MKVVLTGSSSGIGEAVARGLASQGARLSAGYGETRVSKSDDPACARHARGLCGDLQVIARKRDGA